MTSSQGLLRYFLYTKASLISWVQNFEFQLLFVFSERQTICLSIQLVVRRLEIIEPPNNTTGNFKQKKIISLAWLDQATVLEIPDKFFWITCQTRYFGVESSYRSPRYIAEKNQTASPGNVISAQNVMFDSHLSEFSNIYTFITCL